MYDLAEAQPRMQHGESIEDEIKTSQPMAGEKS
jgi:hypothetical protein